MKVIIAALFLAGIMSAQQQKKQPDNYERSKECAVLAKKLLARNQAEAASIDAHMFLERSHYSPKYQKCFAYIYTFGGGEMRWDLIDVIEDFTMARRGHKSPNIAECSIGKQDYETRRCYVVSDYIDEHLKN